MKKHGKVIILMRSNDTLVRWSLLDHDVYGKHIKDFKRNEYLGWKLFDNNVLAQVWIHSAGLEIINLTTSDDPTGIPIMSKYSMNIKTDSNDTMVNQSIKRWETGFQIIVPCRQSSSRLTIMISA